MSGVCTIYVCHKKRLCWCHLFFYVACRFDVRGKPLQQARHWSAPEIFGPRAKFNTDTDPATLDIEVSLTPQSCSLIPKRITHPFVHASWSLTIVTHQIEFNKINFYAYFLCFMLSLFIQDIRRHDEGVYRCRVDFRTSQTQSFRYNLTVVSKYTSCINRNFI
jgi:hypothetical protein